MADIIDFGRYAAPDALDREKLLAYLETVRAQISELDEQEPEDMESAEYEDWGGRHEELEDLLDELRDLLDEMGGPYG